MSDDGDAPDADADDDDGVGNPPSPSLASSAAPEAQPQQVSASQLEAHPVWAASRGGGGGGGSAPRAGNGGAFAVPGNGRGSRGRGRGGRSRAGSENGDIVADRPRFERISLAALEAGQYQDGDGADSRIESDEDEDHFARVRPLPEDRPTSNNRHAKRKKHKAKGMPHNEGGAPGDDDDDDDDEGDEEDEENEENEEQDHRRRNKLEGLMGAAAFGGGGRRGHYGSGISEDESMRSEASSKRKRDAYKEAFPVRGVTCVGCALANRIGSVNRFVRDNISQMTDDSLWKMSALCYKRDVAEPAEREGNPVPAWGWKDVRLHYELHARHKMIRQLQNMRAQQEERLVRVDGNEKELDRQGADLMLKIMAAESRERQLLEQQLTGGKK